MSEHEALYRLRIITGAEQTSEALRRATLMEASGVTDDLNAVFSGIAAKGALFPMDIIKLDECGVNVQPVLDWIRKEAR